MISEAEAVRKAFLSASVSSFIYDFSAFSNASFLAGASATGSGGFNDCAPGRVLWLPVALEPAATDPDVTLLGVVVHGCTRLEAGCEGAGFAPGFVPFDLRRLSAPFRDFPNFLIVSLFLPVGILPSM